MPSKIKVDQIAGASGNTVTIPAGQTLDLSGATITLPANAVTTTGTQTLTNKTIDIQSNTLTGTLPVNQGGTGLTNLGSANTVLKVNSSGNALTYGSATGNVVKLGETYMGGTSFTSMDLENTNTNCYFNPQYKHIKFVFTDFTPQTDNSYWHFRIKLRDQYFTNGYYYNVTGYVHYDNGYWMDKTVTGGDRWNMHPHGEGFDKYNKMNISGVGTQFAFGDNGSWDSNLGNEGNTSRRWGNITEVTFPYWRSTYPSDESYKTGTGSGTISGTTLTISSVTSGGYYPFQFIYGNGIPTGTYIKSQSSGTTAGVGTYTINNSLTIGSSQTINGGDATEVSFNRDNRWKTIFYKSVFMRGSGTLNYMPSIVKTCGFFNRTEQNQQDYRSSMFGLRVFNNQSNFWVANNNPNCKLEWFGFNDDLLMNGMGA